MSRDDLGKLVLRASLGVLMLMHGVHKLIHGLGDVIRHVENAGLPSFIAYGVYVGEVIAPLLMIIGFYTRPAAAIFAFTMLMAVALANPRGVLELTGAGAWGIELQALFFTGAVAVALLGAGRYSVSRGQGRFD